MAEYDETPDDRLVHGGRGDKSQGRAVNLPIHQSSTMLFDSLEAFEAAREDRYRHGTLYYGRYGNPATFELERLVAELEGAQGCVAVSSGLASIAFSLSAVTKAGDHILVADNVYGPTRGFCESVLSRFGIEVSYFNPMIEEAMFADLFRDNTTAVMFEAPGSGTFEVADTPMIARVTRKHGARSIIDNTWATPIYCNPLALGVDISVHSGSKYICGHADAMIGFVCCNADTFDRVRKCAIDFGERPGGQDVFLALRGLRTLAMRMRHANVASIEIAEWLAGQSYVRRVLHPAFDSCPGHRNWLRDFSGAAGLFSVVLEPVKQAKLRKFVDSLTMFGIGVSWGGFESLVLPVEPYRTASNWSAEGHVVRFAIGLESTASLKADLEQALGKIADRPKKPARKRKSQ